ncbi:MAG: hypothetical protein ACOX2L_05125 [Anaerolineae bacterium]|jgi:hypothetical protein
MNETMRYGESGMVHSPRATLRSIVCEERKTTSYKIALIRALGDIAYRYPMVGEREHPVAVPLEEIANYWLAYYWPFVDRIRPIWQGRRSERSYGVTNDLVFRDALSSFRAAYESAFGYVSAPCEGYFVMWGYGLLNGVARFGQELLDLQTEAIKALVRGVKMPIQFAGVGQWSVLGEPRRMGEVSEESSALPGIKNDDLVVLIEPALWHCLQTLSDWIEALCVQEWSLYTEGINRDQDSAITRQQVYGILTDRPGNRCSLSFEFNQTNVACFESEIFGSL